MFVAVCLLLTLCPLAYFAGRLLSTSTQIEYEQVTFRIEDKIPYMHYIGTGKVGYFITDYFFVLEDGNRVKVGKNTFDEYSEGEFYTYERLVKQ